MMRSMFSGVSGLKTHQMKMDIIGNNISNVNTVGYKASRATFQEVFSQTMRGASAPDSQTGRGGTNPMQIGLGTGVATVDLLYTRGSVQRTDNVTDLSVEGDGLFIVKAGNTGSFNFTRAGNFNVDKQGNLVAANGANVYGWMKNSDDPLNPGSKVFDTNGSIEPINIYSDAYTGNKKIIKPMATDSCTITGNLDLKATNVPADAVSVPITVFDEYGKEYKAQAVFQKSAVAHTWNWTVQDTGAPAKFPLQTGTAVFDTTPGNVGRIASITGGAAVAGYPTKADITLTPADTTVPPMKVRFDFGKLTEYDAENSAKVFNVNGYSTGTLTTYNIGSDGTITGIYSNGQQQPLGLIGLASFDNPAGLQKVGENMFIATTNSGDFKGALKPGAAAGTINPGTLEMSNVDLSKEFTEMITTQRGFQANSRIITTSDQILEELVNMKR